MDLLLLFVGPRSLVPSNALRKLRAELMHAGQARLIPEAYYELFAEVD